MWSPWLDDGVGAGQGYPAPPGPGASPSSLRSMRGGHGQLIEVTSLDDFDRRIRRGVSSLSGWHLHGVDLSGRTEVLRTCWVGGALFLGCVFAPGDEESVRARGGIVFPSVPGSPVDTYRSTLYRPEELFDAPRYHDSFDAHAYAWSTQRADRETALVSALHDLAIDQALTDWIRGRDLVGVMGGHALVRGEPAYADAALLGQLLGAHTTVATGGGPGAMEAANLGAWLAHAGAQPLAAALDRLAEVPHFRPDIGAWAHTALAVLRDLPGGNESLGVPTWHYGHEPPNPFATSIAKYFRNSVRESILLQICNRGIVFLPGAAGTVQEVFQDACENYYADESSVARMVLVGTRYWTQELPAWPLLEALARGRHMAGRIHLVDSVAEAAALIEAG